MPPPPPELSPLPPPADSQNTSATSYEFDSDSPSVLCPGFNPGDFCDCSGGCTEQHAFCACPPARAPRCCGAAPLDALDARRSPHRHHFVELLPLYLLSAAGIAAGLFGALWLVNAPSRSSTASRDLDAARSLLVDAAQDLQARAVARVASFPSSFPKPKPASVEMH